MTERIKSLPHLPFTLGVVMLLTWLPLLFPFIRYGEGRDTLFYVFLTLVFPLLLWLQHRQPNSLSNRIEKLPPYFLGVLWLVSASLQINQLGRSLTWPLAVVTGVIGAAIDGLVLWGVSRLILKKSGWESGLGIVATFVYLATKLSDNNRFLNFLGWPQAIHAVVMVLGFALAWYSLVGRTDSDTSKAKVADVFWLIVFLGVLLVPLPLLTPPDLLHLSYYLGPISLIQQGAIPLYSVPSQYGFLSVLLPASLSEFPVIGMQRAMGLIFFLQAAVTYSVLRRLAPGMFRLWAGLLTLVLVLLLPGERHGFGSFSCPSTGAYRFFWVLALTLLYVTDRKGKLPLKCLVFVLGCLWSFESALYCVATVATGMFFEVLIAREVPSAFVRAAIPFGVLAAVVALVEVLFRSHYGVAPDWYGFVEYALSYAGGYGALPMEPWGAINPILVSFALLGAFAVSDSLRSQSPFLGVWYAWGSLSMTLSYFVSRSHPQNVCNLFASWFPILGAVALGVTKEWRFLFRTLLCLLSATIFAIGVGDGATIARIVASVKTPARMEQTIPVTTDGGGGIVPLVSWVDDKNFLEHADPKLRPWLPTQPYGLFIILSDERQEKLLERYLSRQVVSRGMLLRKLPPNATEAAWLTQIAKYYVKVDEKPVGAHVLETYERK